MDFYDPQLPIIGRFFNVSENQWPFDPKKAARATWKIIMAIPSIGNHNEMGTLFFVSENGHFVTNWHVMSHYIFSLATRKMFDIQNGYQGQKGAITLRPGGKIYLKNSETGQMLAIDKLSLLFIPGQKQLMENFDPLPDNDFVIGQIDNLKTETVKLARSSCCLIDRSVFSIGYPHPDTRIQDVDFGADGNEKASQGKIENYMRVGLLKQPVMITSLPLAGGASGSPVFSSRGEVVGVYAGGGETLEDPGKIKTAVVTAESIVKKLKQFESSKYLADLISQFK